MKKKIFSLIVLPVLALGAIVILISITVVKGALINEIEDALRSAATATFAAYDQNTGEYLEAQNGDIWKGSYNISKSESIVDRIKEKSGMEVTFFYGDRRVMTSAVDEDGERILGSPAGEKVKKQVLEGGEEYFSKAVSIDGTLCYGYYIPVCQDGSDTPIGMIFVGTNKEEKDAAINRIVYAIITVTMAVMLICIVLAAFFTTSMTSSLEKSIGMVESVARGDLKTKINENLLKRKDEIGDLSRAVKILQGEMAKSIETIAENARAVWDASGELENTARDTTVSMKEVGEAVNSLAESASAQAAISAKASDNIEDMGERIEQTSKEMAEMKLNAQAMHESEEKNSEMIHKLLQSNEEVRRLVEEISAQTQRTNDSAQKIKDATEIIASIADETSLLSLNASIEAARAGENGKGFAVVADQIQKLANLSNESSMQIDEIVSKLMEDSNMAVSIMEKVAGTIENQTNNIQETRSMTDEVMSKLQESLESMNVIENSVLYLDNARKEIVETVAELSEIAGKNASTTQEVSSNTNLVSENFRQVEESTEGLKSIAGGLEESMKHFSV